MLRTASLGCKCKFIMFSYTSSPPPHRYAGYQWGAITSFPVFLWIPVISFFSAKLVWDRACLAEAAKWARDSVWRQITMWPGAEHGWSRSFLTSRVALLPSGPQFHRAGAAALLSEEHIRSLGEVPVPCWRLWSSLPPGCSWHAERMTFLWCQVQIQCPTCPSIC